MKSDRGGAVAENLGHCGYAILQTGRDRDVNHNGGVEQVAAHAQLDPGVLCGVGGWALDGMDSFIYAMVLVAIYTLWVPEQYRTECRASAFAFSTSVGRFAGAGITFLVGAGVRHFQTIGIPVALTAVAFVIGLLPIPFGEETKGKALPA